MILSSWLITCVNLTLAFAKNSYSPFLSHFVLLQLWFSTLILLYVISYITTTLLGFNAVFKLIFLVFMYRVSCSNPYFNTLTFLLRWCYVLLHYIQSPKLIKLPRPNNQIVHLVSNFLLLHLVGQTLNNIYVFRILSFIPYGTTAPVPIQPYERT